jgi:hypothetical protein
MSCTRCGWRSSVRHPPREAMTDARRIRIQATALRVLGRGYGPPVALARLSFSVAFRGDAGSAWGARAKTGGSGRQHHGRGQGGRRRADEPQSICRSDLEARQPAQRPRACRCGGGAHRTGVVHRALLVSRLERPPRPLSDHDPKALRRLSAFGADLPVPERSGPLLGAQRTGVRPCPLGTGDSHMSASASWRLRPLQTRRPGWWKRWSPSPSLIT